jgi:hypothetical protein
MAAPDWPLRDSAELASTAKMVRVIGPATGVAALRSSTREPP